MKLRHIAVAALIFCLVKEASAHRLNEYLQATLLSVDRGHLQASMRLIPGAAVSPSIIASIDSDRDGVLSEAEQRAYADRVLGNLSIAVDGIPVRPKLLSATFPQVEQMKEGLGEIHIEFSVNLPPGGTSRRVILEDHPENANSVYLVNALMPTDPAIRIVAQTRNQQQSFYQLDYVQSSALTGPVPGSLQSNLPGLIGRSGFTSLFQLGIRHIAEGTDHLLFLLALLLPAPLIASGSRWVAYPDSIQNARRSLGRVFRVVTAFTIGHSITLALAAMELIRLHPRPIEVLIAVSILVSAIHAIRPLFPGKEAAIAAFFGLVHGLAFAATLSQLGLGRWERVTGILGFNLGIETMQLAVVAATIPSLLLMGRTRAYGYVRISGALFAAFASFGWIAERLLGALSGWTLQ